MMIALIQMVVLIILIVIYVNTKDEKNKNELAIVIKIYVSLFIVIVTAALWFIIAIDYGQISDSVRLLLELTVLSYLLPLWNKNHRILSFIIVAIFTVLSIIAYLINMYSINKDEGLRIKTDVNINIEEYMPFEENSKIARLDSPASLKLTTDLPTLDGAAAVFPLYSSFINAVYPDTVTYGEKPFVYNNTVRGYMELAEKETDIFFGAYPSEEQINYAQEQGIEFEYTEIGKEGFIFFVNKENPITSLTSEQIKGIYSGEITNWSEVGGKDEKIVAFQRNEGSGSQSMLVRFMGDTPIMEAPTEEVNDFMSGIIDQVADYKNYSNSIGFSFRYYFDTLIANPNVKMIAVDGVKPTLQNITNDTYPIVTSLYAVTYKGNENDNVEKLLNWILSEEGQELVEKTGYARVN
ncbi:MAG: substrate-binding domain-containing protein [Bacilli bacterium]|nr:substrate-binding domain-containing protein [Bacilli bacterium]